MLIATLAAVVVLTLGCISPPEKTESTNLTDKSAGITTLRIGYQPSTHQIAEMVASEMGWWAEDLSPFGITEIKEFEFPTGVPEMQAMVAGEL
ncbi:MAG TPA: sulfonate ABC transporter substrate-binding protein, partial [Methanothrix soehngenii]|nr:sulfonate ABC transporter substrate-binding protein [Methanothrix soehngenii]